jgi:hypothetical protein
MKRRIRIRSVLFRIGATFTAQALSVIGVGSMFGVSVLTSSGIAGGIGVARVIESLSRAYLRDGVLTEYEINKAFASNTEGTQVDLKSESSSTCNCTCSSI